MDEDTMNKILLIGMILLLVLSFLTFNLLKMGMNKLNEGMQCNEVVDKIYEQCREESEINITTLEGRDTTLKYENGVCIIK